MSTIKLNDDSTLSCSSIFGQRKHIYGETRESMTIYFNKSEYSLEDIYDTFSDPTKTCKITIINQVGESEDTEEFIHLDYTILDSISLTNEVVSNESNTEAEVTNEVIAVCIGQKTYTEKVLEDKASQVDDLCVIMADILGGAE